MIDAELSEQAASKKTFAIPRIGLGNRLVLKKPTPIIKDSAPFIGDHYNCHHYLLPLPSINLAQFFVAFCICPKFRITPMSDKSIRWADSNEFYYASLTNSPTSSSSGSPGPMTPPPTLPDVATIHDMLRFKRNLGFVNDLLQTPEEGTLDRKIFA
ncbi:hypothetical protein LENED_008674 [Lentinula edodes]|uniref:Uncharacterized protein n=1 Tax=Lentinula edodes TaxID=5353 RepID=A0A1Q3EHR9_LENED|nr:hypothetical protein LENED_008674 [Lentinula edodes]